MTSENNLTTLNSLNRVSIRSIAIRVDRVCTRISYVCITQHSKPAPRDLWPLEDCIGSSIEQIVRRSASRFSSRSIIESDFVFEDLTDTSNVIGRRSQLFVEVADALCLPRHLTDSDKTAKIITATTHTTFRNE